mmetsp:Transcript_48264/g.137859  ORF Transcript_48264/g.137859 Transcript_48264/m.137859 type:complete len:254 (-) Transcript_48264:166-927(-)
MEVELSSNRTLTAPLFPPTPPTPMPRAFVRTLETWSRMLLRTKTRTSMPTRCERARSSNSSPWNSWTARSAHSRHAFHSSPSVIRRLAESSQVSWSPRQSRSAAGSSSSSCSRLWLSSGRVAPTFQVTQSSRIMWSSKWLDRAAYWVLLPPGMETATDGNFARSSGMASRYAQTSRWFTRCSSWKTSPRWHASWWLACSCSSTGEPSGMSSMMQSPRAPRSPGSCLKTAGDHEKTHRVRSMLTRTFATTGSTQ